jgi:hypothetical protein
MAKAGAFQSGQVPIMVKAAVALVGVAALVGVGVFIYRKLKEIGGQRENREEAQDSSNELDILLNQGVQPTISQAEAQTKSNILVAAANDCDPWGQGAQQIMQVIYSLKNKADWFLLSSTFGVRSWDDCPYGSTNGSLSVLLVEELDTNQMTEVRRHIGQFGISI